LKGEDPQKSFPCATPIEEEEIAAERRREEEGRGEARRMLGMVAVVAVLLVVQPEVVGPVAGDVVRTAQKISDTQGNFRGGLRNNDQFGFSVANLGDLDLDGTQDLAVGAVEDVDGGLGRGAVYVLLLHPNGTVKTEQKISDTQGNFQGALADYDYFGYSVTGLGDIDGDATNDLAVGAAFDDDFDVNCGAVYVLFLHPSGTVKAEQKISGTQGNFRGVLQDSDYFGGAVAGLGDLDGDATRDLAVGAFRDDDGGTDRGAVYMLFLHRNGTVKAEQKISSTQGNFQGVLTNSDIFGTSIASLGDVDGDATQDIAVGAFGDDDGGPNRGAVYVLFLHQNGTVKAEQKISDTEGNFQGVLNNSDGFGISVASLGDIDGDATQDLAVGAESDDGGGVNRGAVYVLFLHPNGTVKGEQKISDTEGEFQGVLDDLDNFGGSVTGLGDHDGDATQDLAVGARYDRDGGANRGSVYVLFLNQTGNEATTGVDSSTTGANAPSTAVSAVSTSGASTVSVGSTAAVPSTTGLLSSPPPGSDVAASSDVSSSDSTSLLLIVAGGAAALCLLAVVVAVVVVRRQRLSGSAATSSTGESHSRRPSDSSSDASSSGAVQYVGFAQVTADDANRDEGENYQTRPSDGTSDAENNYQTPDFHASLENPYNAL
jgi:FG-GAP repeat